MHANRVALVALVVAGLIAGGCGSDDDPEPQSERPRSEAAQDEKDKPDKPQRKSVRAQMIECIEGELGFEVAPEDDPDSLAVKGSGGERKAVVVIHSDVGAARKAVARTLSKGTNAVTFGRAEFIRHKADDTEAGVIANCVSIQYNRP